MIKHYYLVQKKKYKKLIFSDYDDYEICIETNNIYINNNYDYYSRTSKFNQPLSNLLNNLTQLQQLTLGNDYNQPLSNSLDNSIFGILNSSFT